MFSGTHLNPCVTLGIFIAGEVRSYLAVLYVLMQVLGGSDRLFSDDTRKSESDCRSRGSGSVPFADLGKSVWCLSWWCDSVESQQHPACLAGESNVL